MINYATKIRFIPLLRGEQRLSQLWGVQPRIISNLAFVSPNFDPGISLKGMINEPLAFGSFTFLNEIRFITRFSFNITLSGGELTLTVY